MLKPELPGFSSRRPVGGFPLPPYPLAASALAIGLLFAAFAAQAAPWNGVVNTTVNSLTKTVGFGGQQWVVIGNDAQGGVYANNATTSPSRTPAPTNSITLLLMNGSAGGVYPNSAFNTNGNDENGYSNYYNGSTLQSVLEGIANALPGKEQGVINPRYLAHVTSNITGEKGYISTYTDRNTGDGINGADAPDQLLWALSYPEWQKIGDKAVRKYDSNWWLRSPMDGYYRFDFAMVVGGYDGDYCCYLDSVTAVRPAFNLNLESVLFTSESSAAAGSGKSGATVGGAWTAASPPSTAQKFTFLDPTIATPNLTLTGGASGLNFAFTDATPGTNMYVSGFLQGTNSYYAKYADTASANSGNFNAAGSSDTLGVNPGTYLLHLFGEEANTYLYSDFASNPVDFRLTVNASGKASDLVLLSDVAFGLDGGTIGLEGGQTYTQTWTLGAGDNTLHIAYGDAEISGNIGGTGGFIKTGDDTLTLSGTNTYTGMTTVQEGTLTLTGSITSDSLTLHDGTTFDANLGTVPTLAQLDVHGSANYDGNLNATGGAMNFYLPTTFGAGGTLLTVTGTADITGSTVNVGIEGSSSPLQTSDTVTLIDAGTLSATGINTTANAQGMLGVTLKYDFDLTTMGNTLLATVSGPGATVNEQAKALSEGHLAGMSNLLGGADLAAGQGVALATRAAQSPGQRSPQAFGTISGGSLRHDTGSHIDVDGYHLLAGVATGGELAGLSKAQTTLGAFFEYGEGDYDTHNSFATAARVKGQGDTDYAGIGVLGRLDFAGNASGHPYAEATLRTGRVSSDFHSSDLRDSQGRRASFESKASYYGASLGAGHLWQVSEKASLTAYGNYLWTHENGDSVRLSTGDPVKFSAVDSQRLRLGARYSQHIGDNKAASAYAGLAWEREFDGKARAKTHGYRIDAPSLKGNTTLLELGLTLNPLPTRPLDLDIGVQGYTGQRKGITGSIKGNYRF
ncbi:MAG: autotransporter domain-containing protein [Azoarcus sp.]|jgi:autotransporter-associated beta strand protein|nr:autotransporter domain-containing protein [Azoarcus sp.]